MTTSSNLRPRYDAIVVGARCAGAATAMLLARAGRSVLVVDRGQPGVDTLSTHALRRRAPAPPLGAPRRGPRRHDAISLGLFEVTDRIASFEWDLEEAKRDHHALARHMAAETELLLGLDRAAVAA